MGQYCCILSKSAEVLPINETNVVYSPISLQNKDSNDSSPKSSGSLSPYPDMRIKIPKDKIEYDSTNYRRKRGNNYD